MEFRCGGLLFTSKFDSGNLARVEKVSRDDDEEDSGMLTELEHDKTNKMLCAPSKDWSFQLST